MMSGFDDSFNPPAFTTSNLSYAKVHDEREAVKALCDLIISYHRHHGQYRIADLLSWPLFHNKQIARHLGAEKYEQWRHLLDNCLVEWEDPIDEPMGALLICSR